MAQAGGTDGGVVLTVGQPHPLLLRRRDELPEGCVVGNLGGVPALTLCLERVTARDVEVVEHGALRLGLEPLPPWGYLWLAELAGFGQIEGEFSPCLEPPGARELPERAPEEYRVVHLHLVELAELRVRAMRMMAVPPDFAVALEALHRAALDRLDSFGRGRWFEALAQRHGRTPLGHGWRRVVAETFLPGRRHG